MKTNQDKKRFRVGILLNNGKVESASFDTREEADDYILSNEGNVKLARIKDRTIGITETIKDF